MVSILCTPSQILKFDPPEPIIDENGNPIYKKVSDVLNEFIIVLKTITENSIYLEGQKVYETGFEPLPEGFEPGPDPLEIFAQWIELVPTNQVVPVRYEDS